jgi:hypothetical protein
VVIKIITKKINKMKKSFFIVTIMLLGTLVFQSCDDQEEVLAPSFEVAFNATAKVGEPVEFAVNNAPDFLSFFSGEFSSEFKNSERATAEGDFFLSFVTTRHYFDGASRSDNAWSFLVSTDYSGSGTIEDVQAATWTDLTDEFVFATARTWSPKTESGAVNITQFAGDLPTYFAVRIYAEGKKSEGNRQGNFHLDDFNITLAVANEDYSIEVANLQTPGFKPVNVEGTHPTIAAKDNWINKGSLFEMNGDQAEYTNDDWLITNPVNLSGSVAPDRGTPLKTYLDKLENFEHTYSEPGTYSIAFVGTNQTIYGKKQEIKEYTITVTE